MRAAIVAFSAPCRNAIGSLVAEKAEFFAERGAEVRVLLQSTAHLDSRLRAFAQRVDSPATSGPIWNDLVGCDLVFFEHSQDFPLLGWLPRLAGTRPRVVVDYYGVSPPDGWPGPQRLLLEDGVRKRGLIGFAEVAVVLSRFCRDELVRSGVAEERIVQQRIPLDRDVWRPQDARPISDRKVLLFVGRLAPNKRLSVAIEALARLHAADERRDFAPSPPGFAGGEGRGEGGQHPSRNSEFLGGFAGPPSPPSPLPPQSRGARGEKKQRPIEFAARLTELWIAGDGSDIYAEEARRCRELAARLGVADRVRWCGAVDDLPALYRQADVLVMPSIHEGLGIPVLEAQATGVPVVAARSTALIETVGAGGLTFEPDDVDDCVRCLRAALTPEIAADLRRRGFERVRGWSRPDWRREFGAFVERLLDSEPIPRRRALHLRSPRSSLTADVGARAVVVPLVIGNVGDLPIASDKPLRLRVETRDEATGCHASTHCEVRIAEPIPAAGCQRVVVSIDVPDRAGNYALTLTPESGLPLEVPLSMSEPREEGLSQLLDMADTAVAAAESHRALPTDFVDVTEGLFAPLKRWLKRKLLGNFKVGYIDVANRQQAEVNRNLVDAVRQLAECCRELERRSDIAPGLPGVRSVASENITPIDTTCATPGKPGAI
jgi:glycosyltransferase involved in cell wall biosynthesis